MTIEGILATTLIIFLVFAFVDAIAIIIDVDEKGDHNE